MTPPLFPLHILPAGARSRPEWVPDSTCSHCSACRAPFTLLRRRHHCRSCGKVRGGGLGRVRGSRSRGSTRCRSLPADLLRPLLTAHCCAAALRPAQTCACLHALPRHAPLVLAHPHPLRGPGCGTWLWGCWADPVPVGPGGRRTARPVPAEPGAAPSPGLETCLVAVLLRCVFAGELWLLLGPGQSLPSLRTVLRRAQTALT